MNKNCWTCKQTKEINQFCKNKNSKDGYNGRCKGCHAACFQRNIIKRKLHQKQYELENREHILQKKREYCAAHRQEKKIYDLKYRDEHRKEIAALKRDWQYRHKDDPINKIKKNLRRRLHHVLKGYLKAQNTFALVGCDAAGVKIHLESLFKPGMTWENYGLGNDKWHIDHIRPCCSFDLSKPEEQAKCFHFTNLQPLWEPENLAKGRKY